MTSRRREAAIGKRHGASTSRGMALGSETTHFDPPRTLPALNRHRVPALELRPRCACCPLRCFACSGQRSSVPDPKIAITALGEVMQATQRSTNTNAKRSCCCVARHLVLFRSASMHISPYSKHQNFPVSSACVWVVLLSGSGRAPAAMATWAGEALAPLAPAQHGIRSETCVQ